MQGSRLRRLSQKTTFLPNNSNCYSYLNLSSTFGQLFDIEAHDILIQFNIHISDINYNQIDV